MIGLRRLALVLALAASAAAGARVASASVETETLNRSGLLACVLVDEATRLGQDPFARIPETNLACLKYRFYLRTHPTTVIRPPAPRPWR